MKSHQIRWPGYYWIKFDEWIIGKVDIIEIKGTKHTIYSSPGDGIPKGLPENLEVIGIQKPE